MQYVCIQRKENLVKNNYKIVQIKAFKVRTFCSKKVKINVG